MAQWQELLKLDSALQKRVMSLYEGKFPTEVRHSLSHWIESQDCNILPELTCFPSVNCVLSPVSLQTITLLDFLI
uniref:STAT transcription factor protein interaction domain-containing protein n=1 Tax=Cyprinodon variegatus TaxID=28743 RepID=A0A3Q2GKJ5_CYPVA